MTGRVEVNGTDVILRDLGRLSDGMAREVIRKMAAIAYATAEEGARKHTKPSTADTQHGALLQSLYNRQGADGVSRAVGHDPRRAPHALFVNFGTRPHKIKPKNKSILRWVGPNGRYVYAKEVDHPGYAGDAYIVRAADDALQQFSQIVDQVFKEQTK
jgi:hypothetical protein